MIVIKILALILGCSLIMVKLHALSEYLQKTFDMDAALAAVTTLFMLMFLVVCILLIFYV